MKNKKVIAQILFDMDNEIEQLETKKKISRHQANDDEKIINR